LFGGTFDPVHQGHVHGAISVCDALELHTIRLVLSARPPHRDPTAADLTHRWQMLLLACEVDARLVADDCELRRDRPSFAVETLVQTRAAAGAESILWVIGSDALADLPSWYRWQEMLELCNLVVLERPGPAAAYPEAVQRLLGGARVDALSADPHGQILLLKEAMRSVSASHVRRELSGGHDVGDLLNPRVAAYITQHGLYGVTRDG
jgi:nicotinate-nucleotide adenylyltransferase